MKRIAIFLYKRICRLGILPLRGAQVESDLAQLHPGERLEGLRAEYYVKKLTLFLAVLLAGAVFGAVIKGKERWEAGLDGEGGVVRGAFESGEKQLWLEADDGKNKKSFQITVKPRRLAEEELTELSDSFLEEIGEHILNGNADLRHISGDLDLRQEYEGFPFEVFWESGRGDILDGEGNLFPVEAPTGLELRVELVCGEWRREESLFVTAVPASLTEEEQEYLELRELLLRTEEASREEETWRLPEEWRGREIKWSLRGENYGVIIWAATPAAAVLIYILSDWDLHEKLEKRRKSMRREYPELVYKMLLYMGAGMNIRGAFRKIGTDYEKKKKRNGRLKPACEEVLYTCRELQGGVSEGTAYGNFGKRAGTREYIRLGSLLGQNLKRGSSTLLDRLREEAEKASGESLQQVRRLGEEAGTKLLVPMVMMLAVVMVIIMIPAFGVM